jgi:hypothetical protein
VITSCASRRRWIGFLACSGGTWYCSSSAKFPVLNTSSARPSVSSSRVAICCATSVGSLRMTPANARVFFFDRVGICGGGNTTRNRRLRASAYVQSPLGHSELRCYRGPHVRPRPPAIRGSSASILRTGPAAEETRDARFTRCRRGADRNSHLAAWREGRHRSRDPGSTWKIDHASAVRSDRRSSLRSLPLGPVARSSSWGIAGLA